MTTTYRVIEAGATEPNELESWMNEQARSGWRVVSVTSLPASAVPVRVGGSFLHPERDELRGFTVDGIGSGTFRSTVVFNLWVTLEHTA